MKYTIDYEYGTAILYTPAKPENALERFYHLANQCFGIRKSVGDTKIVASEPFEGLPEEWKRFRTGVELLTHHGDVAIWNAKGKKIKSEFD